MWEKREYVKDKVFLIQLEPIGLHDKKNHQPVQQALTQIHNQDLW